jgi:hypothetical protein
MPGWSRSRRLDVAMRWPVIPANLLSKSSASGRAFAFLSQAHRRAKLWGSPQSCAATARDPDYFESGWNRMALIALGLAGFVSIGLSPLGATRLFRTSGTGDG